MAAFDTSRPMTETRHGSGRPTLFVAALGAVAAWRDARATRKALAALSDHELDDIGLTRSDVDVIAGRLGR